MSSGVDFESADEMGRVQVYGFLLGGDLQKGYRARLLIPLSALEVSLGLQDVIFHEFLPEILVQLHAESIKREMVGRSMAADAPNQRTALDGEPVTGAQNLALAMLGREGPLHDHEIALRLGRGLMDVRSILSHLRQRGLVRCQPDDTWTVAKPLDPPVTRP
jgi:hypothetical protein